MKNLMWLWAFGLLPGLFGTAATAGSAITSNPLMLMMLMGGRINSQTLMLLMLMQGQTGTGASLLGTGSTSSLIPMMMLMNQRSGGSRRRSRRPQTIVVRNRRY